MGKNNYNDDILRIEEINKMITILNNRKAFFSNVANGLYKNKDKYIKYQYNRMFRKYILIPEIILCGIGFGIVELIQSKLLTFLILCMTFVNYKVLRKVIPEFISVPTDYFDKEYNSYMSKVYEIEKELTKLYDERINIMKRVNESKNIPGINLEQTNEKNNLYCRIRKK